MLEEVSQTDVAPVVLGPKLVPASSRQGLPVVRRRWTRIDVGTGVLGLILMGLALFTYHLFDFKIFWEAGRHLISGDRIYPSREALDLNSRSYFVYPPIVAALFVPLSLLPLAVAGTIYVLLSVGAIYATLRVLGVMDVRCYLVLLLWMPVLQAVGLGTIAPFLVLVLALAWRYRSRPICLSLALGVGVAAKLFLWPLLFWLLATRRWRAGVMTAAASAAFVLLPWAALGFRDFLWYPHALRLLLDHEQGTGFSVAAVLVPLHFTPLTIAIQVLAVTSVFWFARRPEGDRRAFSAAVVCALVLSPLVWIHYFAVLVVPIALVQRTFGWLWLLPVLAFWPPPNNLHHLWIAAIVSAVLTLSGVLTLRSRWPHPNPT